MLAIFGTLGPQEILLILLLGLILFGARRLPELGRSLGQGLKEFKRSIRDISSDDEPSPPKPPDPTGSGTDR